MFLELAASLVLWERRAAMVGTLGLIMRGDASTTLEVAALLLDDRQGLIHKAVEWMLRAVGKRIDRDLLLAFFDQDAAERPRTALSYGTELHTPEQRGAVSSSDGCGRTAVSRSDDEPVRDSLDHTCSNGTSPGPTSGRNARWNRSWREGVLPRAR